MFYILHQDPKSIIYRFFEAQSKNKTSKDWVTTVLKDLKELKWNVTFEEIQTMKKATFNRISRQSIEQKTFEDLENKKKIHSKVKHIVHPKMKMQQYLKANKIKITKEEMQLIFKMRCRVTEIRNNLKGLYDSYECEVCNKEEETQEHILNCKEINKVENNEKRIEYEKLFDGSVKDKLEIAKLFKQNFEIRKEIMKKSDKSD